MFSALFSQFLPGLPDQAVTCVGFLGGRGWGVQHTSNLYNVDYTLFLNMAYNVIRHCF